MCVRESLLQARTRAPSKEKAKGPAMPNAALLPLQRDVNLTSFHALGKLLYNKRKGDKDAEDDRLPAAPLGAQLGAVNAPGSIGQVAAECAPDLPNTHRQLSHS